MAFVTFREDKKKARSKFLALLIGLAILFVGWNLLVMDVATTGSFWDSLKLQPVIPPTIFHAYGVSTEGWIIAIFLSGFQIFASYKIAQFQPRSKDWKFWVVLRFASAVVDTFTDINYRSYQFQSIDKSISSFVISVLAFNIGSEWAVTAGFGLVSDNFASAFPFLAELLKVMQEMWKFAKEILSASSKEEKPKGDGGEHHSPRPEPRYSTMPDPKPTFSPSSYGGNAYQAKELGKKKATGRMSDDDFIAGVKKLPIQLRRVAVEELPADDRKRIEAKIMEDIKSRGGSNATTTV